MLHKQPRWKRYLVFSIIFIVVSATFTLPLRGTGNPAFNIFFACILAINALYPAWKYQNR